jgi:hypothetical protein
MAAGTRLRVAARLSLVLLVFCAVLTALGIPWWAPAIGSVALVLHVADQQRRAARAAIAGRR